MPPERSEIQKAWDGHEYYRRKLLIMGYSFQNDLRVGDSDVAMECLGDCQDVIIRILNRELKNKENEFNTDGIINVALVLDQLAGKDLSFLTDYLETFLSKFEKYIQRETASDCWDDESNRSKHIRAYKGILKRLKRKMP